MVRNFSFFLEKGDVRRQPPNKNLSKSTFMRRVERLEFAKISQKANLENAYELNDFDHFRKICDNPRTRKTKPEVIKNSHRIFIFI